MNTTEDTVRAEQEAHDATVNTDDALFDGADFYSEKLALPKIDGKGIDRIAVKVTGEIMLDRSDEADVALWKSLELGKSVDIRLAGKVTGHGGAGATNRDGELDVLVGKKTIKIDTLYVLTPEEL